MCEESLILLSSASKNKPTLFIITFYYAVSKFYETSIYPWLVIGLVFLLSLSILILAYIRQRKKVGVANE